MITARWVKALAGAATMVLVLASSAALAQNNQVKQMEANVLGEQTVFTVDLQGPLAQKPADFTTQNPAKISMVASRTTSSRARSPVSAPNRRPPGCVSRRFPCRRQRRGRRVR